MNQINDNNWPAGKPSASFADAAVERMLAAALVPTVRGSGHRRVAWLLVAALLVSGVALGVAFQGRTRQTLKVKQSVATVKVLPEARKSPVTLNPAPQTRASAAPAVSLPRVSRKAPAAMPKAATSVAVPPAPKVPPCGCERGFGDYMCDCY